MEWELIPHVSSHDTTTSTTTLTPYQGESVADLLAPMGVKVCFKRYEDGSISVELAGANCELEGFAPGEYDLVSP